MHVGTFSGPAGTVLQRTATTHRQAEVFSALQAPEPARLLHLEPAPTAATA